MADEMNQGVQQIAKETSEAIEHDLVKTMKLLEQTKELGFRGVTYLTKQDDEGKLTVSITFPSLSEMQAFKAEQEAQGAGGQVPQNTPGSEPTNEPVEKTEPVQASSKTKVVVRVAGFDSKFSNKFLKTLGLR